MRPLLLLLLVCAPALLWSAEKERDERRRPRLVPSERRESPRPPRSEGGRGERVSVERRERPAERAPGASGVTERVPRTPAAAERAAARSKRRAPRHAKILRDPALVRDFERRRRVETEPNRYYRHTWKRRPYWHYYDRGRYHWYGYYSGPRFHWTLYYGDYWWWYDPGSGRWAYWWGGGWWWPGPAGVVRVYVYDDDPPSAAPKAEKTASWKSPDGTREVQVAGPDAEAYLYRREGEKLLYLKDLGKNVKDVRFSGATADKTLRILLDFKDGGFAVFNGDGAPLDAPSDALQPPPTVPEVPQATPPPPPPAE